MTRGGSCAMLMPWYTFGTSGHVCQPRGSLVASFTHRMAVFPDSGTLAEAELAKEAQGLFPTYGQGKPLHIWSNEPQDIRCGTHGCKGPCAAGGSGARTDLVNCPDRLHRGTRT